MSKLFKVLLVVFSTFAISNYASAISISAGIAGNAMLGFGEATETEDGMMDMSHGSIFAEVGNEMFALGVEYNMEDIDTPEADAIRVDMTTSSTVTAQTNTVKATISEMVTAYVQVMVPNSGFYGKLGMVSADVITKENLGTGGAYGDEDLDGTLVGVGFRNTLDNGLFFGIEVSSTSFDDITAKNTTDSTKQVKIRELHQVGASFRLGKTF